MSRTTAARFPDRSSKLDAHQRHALLKQRRPPAGEAGPSLTELRAARGTDARATLDRFTDRDARQGCRAAC